jgi:hypothetical protein
MGNNPFMEGNEPSITSGQTDAVNLTTKMFFGGDGWPPYFTEDEWIDYGKRLRLPEIDDLRRLISLMSAGFRMDGNSKTRTDQGKRTYLYDHFIQSKARPGVKIIIEGGILQFIQDYQEGKIAIGFTLDELVAEAKKK